MRRQGKRREEKRREEKRREGGNEERGGEERGRCRFNFKFIFKSHSYRICFLFFSIIVCRAIMLGTQFSLEFYFVFILITFVFSFH